MEQKVLIIDDDVRSGNLCTNILIREPHRYPITSIITLGLAEEALERVSDYAPSHLLTFIDEDLPGMQGSEFITEHLPRLQPPEFSYVISMSGSAHPHLEDLLTRGVIVRELLSKPLSDPVTAINEIAQNAKDYFESLKA